MVMNFSNFVSFKKFLIMNILKNFIGHRVHYWHCFSCFQLFNNSPPAGIVSKDSAMILTSGFFGCTVLSFLWMLLYCDVCHVLSALVTMPIAAVLITLLPLSVQFSRSVVSNSLRPHESQHARPPCPSPSLGVHSDSRPSSFSIIPSKEIPGLISFRMDWLVRLPSQFAEILWTIGL